MKFNKNIITIGVSAFALVAVVGVSESYAGIHVKEVIETYHKRGAAELCKKGGLTTKFDSSRFRYRQKGDKTNYGEKIISYAFCGHDKDFMNSEFGKTVASIGLTPEKVKKKLVKAIKLQPQAARAIFCKLERSTMTGIVAEIAKACDYLMDKKVVTGYKSVIDELKAKMKSGIKLKPLRPAAPPVTASTLDELSKDLDEALAIANQKIDPMTSSLDVDKMEDSLEDLGLRFNAAGEIEYYNHDTGTWGKDL